MTTKLEKVDRPLSTEEAIKISGLTAEEYERLFELLAKIDHLIASEVQERMLIHVDGKKELAFDEKRRLMVIDTFGTADEDRWWDEDDYAKGEFIELSKETVRQYYREIGYYDKLVKARKNKAPEPDIPPLPKEKAEEGQRAVHRDVRAHHRRELPVNFFPTNSFPAMIFIPACA